MVYVFLHAITVEGSLFILSYGSDKMGLSPIFHVMHERIHYYTISEGGWLSCWMKSLLGLIFLDFSLHIHISNKKTFLSGCICHLSIITFEFDINSMSFLKFIACMMNHCINYHGNQIMDIIYNNFSHLAIWQKLPTTIHQNTLKNYWHNILYIYIYQGILHRDQ